MPLDCLNSFLRFCAHARIGLGKGSVRILLQQRKQDVRGLRIIAFAQQLCRLATHCGIGMLISRAARACASNAFTCRSDSFASAPLISGNISSLASLATVFAAASRSPLSGERSLSAAIALSRAPRTRL